jgi:hypothetical protein
MGVLESITLVHIDVEYVDCVQQYFQWEKEQRAYCYTCAVVAGFVLDVHCLLQRCCL